MMARIAAVAISLSMIFGTAQAAQDFVCGQAQVRIEIVARDSPAWELRAESVVTVANGGYSTVLRYRGDIDFIGGACLERENKSPLVLFQAYCGGSGCKDLDNWGVIEPATLRVLLVPADGNRRQAAALAGEHPLPALTMMHVLGEARRLGIDVP